MAEYQPTKISEHTLEYASGMPLGYGRMYLHNLLRRHVNPEICERGLLSGKR